MEDGSSDPDNTLKNDILVGESIDAQIYLDLAVRYDVSDNMTARVGINNILDEEPPMTGNTMDPGAFYDQLGRYGHVTLSFKF